MRERKWGLKDGGVLCAEGMELEYFGLDYEGLGKRWLEDDREMVMEEKREINKMRDGCFMGEGKGARGQCNYQVCKQTTSEALSDVDV